MNDRGLTPDEQAALDDAANVLGRMLSVWQVHRDERWPALMFKNQLQLVRENVVKMESMLARFTPEELVHIRIGLDTSLNPSTAAVIAEVIAEDAPDTIPDDWES